MSRCDQTVLPYIYTGTFTMIILRCRTKGVATATYLPPSRPPLPLINSSDKLTSKSSSRRQRVETPIQLWLVNTPYSVTTSTGSLSVVWSFRIIHVPRRIFSGQLQPLRHSLHVYVRILTLLLQPTCNNTRGM